MSDYVISGAYLYVQLDSLVCRDSGDLANRQCIADAKGT